MAEYSAIEVQTVAPGQAVIFTATRNPSQSGYILHRDGTSSFVLNGGSAGCGCMCSNRNRSVNFDTHFKGNIAVATGGTAGEISLSVAVDGTVDPASEMIVTPAAVEEYFNVGVGIEIPIWRGCCETLSIVNTSTQDILVQGALLNLDPPNPCY